MRNLILVITIFFGLQTAKASTLYVGIDWKMAAVASANDLTNGASAGAPHFSLSTDLIFLNIELQYAQYNLKNEETNTQGYTQIDIKRRYLGFGVSVDHGPLLFSRLGLQFNDISTTSFNDQGRTFDSTFDGQSMGLYLGGGLQFPLGNRFALQTSANLELIRSGIVLMSLYVGIKSAIWNF